MDFSHYQYLYKTGDEINDLSTQVSFDEAIVALACLWNDVSYANLAKRNVGALSDDITKAPYKVLFNPGTNAFELLNSVIVVREVEKQLQVIKEEVNGKRHGTCVHGNRLIEHIVLQFIRDTEGFSETVIDVAAVVADIKRLLNIIVPLIEKELNDTYEDSYPANVFKNQTKSKAISEIVKAEIVAKTNA